MQYAEVTAANQRIGDYLMINSKLSSRLFLFAAILFVPCRPFLTNAQEITVRNDSDFTFMDPALITNSNDYTIAANIYSGLLKFNPSTMEPEPDLAKSWSVSPDGLTYTFNLREDVQWHKGYGRLTARDVKYTFDRIMDPKTKSRYRSDFQNVREVEVVNDRTLKIHFKTPDMSFVRKVLCYRPGYIVNQKAIESLKENYKSAPIGTGPFIFERWEPGSKTILVANQDYFLGPPKLKRVTFLMVNEDAVAQLALERGDIDLAVFSSAEDLAGLKALGAVKTGKVILQEQLSLRITYLNINNCKKPFDDIRMRQAVHHAINKEELIAAGFGGQARQANNFLNPGYFAYKPDVAVYEYNPNKAKKLMAVAGFPKGLDATLLYYPGDPWKIYAPIIQEQLRAVGIRLSLSMFDRASMEPMWAKGHLDFLYGNMSRPPDPDIVFSTYLQSTNSPYPNYSCYKNKEVDNLIAQGNQEGDAEKRRQIYHRLQDIIARDTPVIPINYGMDFVARRSQVKGYTYNPLANYLLYNVSVDSK
jgi:peptide/nickel transport system substrate-binding protein